MLRGIGASAKALSPIDMETHRMAASFIEVVAQDGGRFNAYVARPAQGSGPGLVLLQEIFGVNDTMKATADRYAEEGYVVLVPDLFWRIKPGIELGYGDS